MTRHRTDVYREIFAAAYGTLPHLCYFCRDWVYRWGKAPDDGGIHHRDGDHTNNDPANLVAAHVRCHVSHHANGRVMSPASSERKRAANTRRSICPDCGGEYNPIWMTRHVRIGKCVNPTPEQIAEGERYAAHLSDRGRQMWADGLCGNAGRYERSTAYREQMRRTMTGRKQSAETKAKKSEALKRAYAEGRKAKPPGRPRRST